MTSQIRRGEIQLADRNALDLVEADPDEVLLANSDASPTRTMDSLSGCRYR
jgi:hypothetical protein